MTHYCPHCGIYTQPGQVVRDNERCIMCGYKMRGVNILLREEVKDDNA